MPDGALTQTPVAPPEPIELHAIEQMQAAATLLLRQATLMPDRTLGLAWDPRPDPRYALPASPPGQTLAAFLADLAALIARPPSELVADPAATGRLLVAVDYLSCLAAPATADTIALTRTFVDPDNAHVPEAMRRQAACGLSLRRLFRRLRWAAVATLFAAMVLTIHVVWGQSIIGTVKSLRAEMNEAWAAIIAVEATAQQTAPGTVAWTPFCERRSATGGMLDARQAALCARISDVGLRMDLAYADLTLWNGITDTMLVVLSPVRWLAAAQPAIDWGEGPAAELRLDQWRSTEQRTAVMLTSLTVYVVPALIGLLGAFAFVFRRVSAKVEERSIESRDGMQAIFRLFLGVLLGGLVGLFFQPEGIELSGIRLSIAAVAFLVGYSVQVVFEAMDALIGFALGVLRGKATLDR